MSQVIAFGGKKSSGKDTAAKMLITHFGFEQLAFADKLKRFVAKLYDWDLADLYSEEKKEAFLRTPVTWGTVEAVMLENLLQLPDDSLDSSFMVFPSKRVALQYIGTEVLRDHDINFHINSIAETVAANPTTNYVISDCRFDNEIATVKALNGRTIYIERDNLIGANQQHASETSVDKTMFDIVVTNNTTKEDFEDRILVLMDRIVTV